MIFVLLRLALGAILALTALDYFLPALVPLLEPRSLADPMAARLIGVLDASGLLAVAKAIHLAAGAALIVNRAVPFALAAAMPVNVCAAFIAVLLEGDPLPALLALALLALTATLMLAYLPYYRAAMAPGQLADGERAGDGGHYNSLFVDPRGDPGLRDALAGAGVILAALAFYYWVVPFDNGTTGLVTLAFPAAIVGAHLAKALVGGGRVGG